MYFIVNNFLCLTDLRLAVHLRRARAATLIQAQWKSYREHKQFMCIKRAVIYVQVCTRETTGLEFYGFQCSCGSMVNIQIINALQTIARGWFGRQQFNNLRRENKVMVIQRTVRGWMARRHYQRTIRGIIKLQSHVRRKKARRELTKLKVRIYTREGMCSEMA